MWECQECGWKDNQDDRVHCWNCGTGKDGSPPAEVAIGHIPVKHEETVADSRAAQQEEFTVKQPVIPLSGMKKELGILVVLIILCLIAALINPRFLGSANIQHMSRQIGIFGIASIGVGIVIITKGIDLSIGSIFALLGVLFSIMLMEWQWPAALAVIAILTIGASLGGIHGLLVTRVGVQPFIVTLCGLLFYRGLARFIANDETKGFGPAGGFVTLRYLATGSIMGIPMPFLLLILISVIMWFVLHRSVYGRHLFAVGRNEEAARYSGINSQMIIAIAYVLSGAMAGIAGILLAIYFNSILPSSHGDFYGLYVIAAAMVGGCSLRGGKGSIIGIIIGTVLIQVFLNLTGLLGTPFSFAMIGAVILFSAIIDHVLSNETLLWLYCSFDGRIGRRTFWLDGVLLLGVIAALLEILLVVLANARTGAEMGVVILIPRLILFWPALALSVKRWHDRDKSGWWVLINLIPIIGGIWALVETGFLKGTDGSNRFGREPTQSNASLLVTPQQTS